jgi:hypothetical protein
MVNTGMVTAGDMGNRDPVHAFASRLHEILSNPEYSAYISWLPHGRAWKILDKAEFEKNVIPNYFRHARYASFMRQVSFSCSMQKRLLSGVQTSSFLRSLPEIYTGFQRSNFLNT